MKFREDHLEDYQGPSIEFSASDYHHLPRPVIRREATRTSLANGHTRRKSQFSLLEERASAKPQSSGRQMSIADTEQSYDPFRPSRPQLASSKADQSHITVLRGSSEASKGRRTSSNASSIRHPALARVLDGAVYTSNSLPPPLPIALDSHVEKTTRNKVARIYTRSSLASSCRGSLAVNGMRKSVSYKRGVSFQHIRKQSTSTQGTKKIRKKVTSGEQGLHQRYSTEQSSQSTPNIPSPIVEKTPPARGSPVPLPRRGGSGGRSRAQESMVKEGKRASGFWKEETRKVSNELEKFCDEAFNRSSMASSVPTARTPVARTPEQSYESPATSFSIGDYLGRSSIPEMHVRPQKMNGQSTLHTRPLPRPPSSELVGTATQRELAKARELLRKRANDPNGGLQPGALDNMIAELDRLMQSGTGKEGPENGRRASSVPIQGVSSQGAGNINGQQKNQKQSSDTSITIGHGLRVVSEPVTKAEAYVYQPTSRRFYRGLESTIRLVNQDDTPLSPIKPLNIRKRSGASSGSDESTKNRRILEQIETGFNTANPQLAFDERLGNGKTTNDVIRGEERRSAGLSMMEKLLEAIEEDDDKENHDSRAMKTQSGEVKKRSWFRRQPAILQRTEPEASKPLPPPPPPKKERFPLEDEYGIIESKKESNLRNKHASEVRTEDPLLLPRWEQKKGGTFGKGKKLLKIFGRRDSKEAERNQRFLGLMELAAGGMQDSF